VGSTLNYKTVSGPMTDINIVVSTKSPQMTEPESDSEQYVCPVGKIDKGIILQSPENRDFQHNCNIQRLSLSDEMRQHVFFCLRC
jgi:hypothetical protein